MTTEPNYDFPPPEWLKWIFMALAVIWIALCLTSCTTQRKATRYFNAHGFQAAEYCAATFPVKADSIFIPGAVITKSDTTYLPGDSIQCPQVEPGKPPAIVHCPPAIIIRDTAHVIGTLRITKENPAKDSIIAGLQKQNTEQAVRLQIAEDKAKHRGKMFWYLLAGIVLVGGGYLFIKSRTAFFTSLIAKIKNRA